MKETGILFTPENYEKCESGTKTQTRRIVKPQPSESFRPQVGLYCPTRVDHDGEEYPGTEIYGASDADEDYPSRLGRPGDLLYVKEGLEQAQGNRVQYRRDKTMLYGEGVQEWQWQNNYLSSLHMPKWAARLWLEIKNVRMERLQEISEEDARAEGVTEYGHQWRPFTDTQNRTFTARDGFKALWESNKIHKPGSWDLNPWVWVLSFNRVGHHTGED